jgi:hypothetical protein
MKGCDRERYMSLLYIHHLMLLLLLLFLLQLWILCLGLLRKRVAGDRAVVGVGAVDSPKAAAIFEDLQLQEMDLQHFVDFHQFEGN